MACHVGIVSLTAPDDDLSSQKEFATAPTKDDVMIIMGWWPITSAYAFPAGGSHPKVRMLMAASGFVHVVLWATTLIYLSLAANATYMSHDSTRSTFRLLAWCVSFVAITVALAVFLLVMQIAMMVRSGYMRQSKTSDDNKSIKRLILVLGGLAALTAVISVVFGGLVYVQALILWAIYENAAANRADGTWDVFKPVLDSDEDSTDQRAEDALYHGTAAFVAGIIAMRMLLRNVMSLLKPLAKGEGVQSLEWLYDEPVVEARHFLQHRARIQPADQ